MPSLLHEGVLELVRKQPTFAAGLLRQLLDVPVPRFTHARLADTALNQALPIEFRADAVVLFEAGAPVFGAVIEAQLQRDDEKLYSWPYYATSARARHRCPFAVVVVTPDESTALWADQRIELGGGNDYRPLVVGPSEIPRVTDRDEASREPELAVLSAMAHGQGDVSTASAIGAAAAHAIRQLPEDRRRVYSVLLEAALSESARKVMTMEAGLEKFFTDEHRRSQAEGKIEGKAEGKVEGKAEGKAEGKIEEAARLLLKFLSQRRIAVTHEQRQRILDCQDLAVLEGWHDRILTVTTADELFA